ncbi:hypothetical protein Poli38472_003521 [Pythium oligandrum]|uniref:Uncharacterized protein n=1 Tax=Pythium oligandrum TaxID=41045 RepID=A0A8K1C709_PYTOL|nr:hypothetical protein Poli38472_003521 [Pythium oligandrum]|eukprot:TMW57596.1 hypothetical protein Poli38472_003521 [Pythium oligandrum]
MSGYNNEWEADLSSIIEKTNQNLKLLRRIGEKRTDLSSATYDVSTTAPRASVAVGETRQFGASISSRYAAEDMAIRSRTLWGGASASSRRLHRSSSMGVTPPHGTVIRPAVPTNAFEDTEDSGDVGVTATRSGSNKRGSTMAKARSTRVEAAPDVLHPAIDDLRKSLEVSIAAKSNDVEKKLADLRMDVSSITSESAALSQRFNELRDSVVTKMSAVPSVMQGLQDHADAVGRLEKHSAMLLGWKVSVDQDLSEISSKLKSFTAVHDKITALEGHLESLGAILKNRPRHEEKIEELRDRIALLERQLSNQPDTKAVEHLVQMRLSKEINELENRMNQSLAIVTQKYEAKFQALEKSIHTDRIDAITSVKSELLEDMDKLEAKMVKKGDLTQMASTQAQLKDDMVHVQMFFERQDKRFQELKQNSTQIREELNETRQELTKALHAQQNRVNSTLEEKVAHLSILSKERNTKMDQHVGQLDKKQKKLDEATKALHENMIKMQQEISRKQAAANVADQRENDKLRQRLARSIAELEQLHTTKQDLERQYEKQEKHFQSKLNGLRAQVEEQEKQKETQRLELLQALQQESKQMGVAHGKNMLLETLLAKEKVDHEEKNQAIHKSRQEIAAVRQKMRTLENEVDKKMTRLSQELSAKQSMIDSLQKKLKRSEDEAKRLAEAAKRDIKALRKGKELKQQELVLAKMKLKEMEKVAASLMADVDDTSTQMDHAERYEELEARREELENLLISRETEVEDMKQKMAALAMELEDTRRRSQEMTEVTVPHLSTEVMDQLAALQSDLVKKDAEMKSLRESLVEKTEVQVLESALEAVKSEKEDLLKQIKVTQESHARASTEVEATLQSLHAKEVEQLRKRIQDYVNEISEAQTALSESRERITHLEADLSRLQDNHKGEVSKLADKLTDSEGEVVRLTEEIGRLEADKRHVDDALAEYQAALEVAKSENEDQAEQLDALRQHEHDLVQERDQLEVQLKKKTDELAELMDASQRQQAMIDNTAGELEETENRLAGEVKTLQGLLEQERAAATLRERELLSMADVLRLELETLKQDAQNSGESQSSLAKEVASLLEAVQQGKDREQALSSQLADVLGEIVALTQSSSAQHVDQEPTAVIECVRSLTQEIKSKTEALHDLREKHECAAKQAVAETARVKELEERVDEYSRQVAELERTTIALRGELQQSYAGAATHAKNFEDVQEHLTLLREQKHDLESQLEENIAEYENLQSSSSQNMRERQAELAELRELNQKLESTIEEIRDSMEQLESKKMEDLDELHALLGDLENQAAHLNTKSNKDIMGTEKDFYQNQQMVITLGQSVRSIYAKLCSGCGIIELQDLRASLMNEEVKLDRLRQENIKQRIRCVEAEEEVLLNVEFLTALTQNADGNALASKYVRMAPDLLKRLQCIQDAWKAAVASLSVIAVEHTDEELDAVDRSVSDTMAGLITNLEESVDLQDHASELSMSQLDESQDFAAIAESSGDVMATRYESNYSASPEPLVQYHQANASASSDPSGMPTVPSLDLRNVQPYVESCVLLPSSPTAELLQTRLRPLHAPREPERSTDMHSTNDFDDEEDQVADHDSEQDEAAHSEDVDDDEESEHHDEVTSSPPRNQTGVNLMVSGELRNRENVVESEIATAENDALFDDEDTPDNETDNTSRHAQLTREDEEERDLEDLDESCSEIDRSAELNDHLNVDNSGDIEEADRAHDAEDEGLLRSSIRLEEDEEDGIDHEEEEEEEEEEEVRTEHADHKGDWVHLSAPRVEEGGDESDREDESEHENHELRDREQQEAVHPLVRPEEDDDFDRVDDEVEHDQVAEQFPVRRPTGSEAEAEIDRVDEEDDTIHYRHDVGIAHPPVLMGEEDEEDADEVSSDEREDENSFDGHNQGVARSFDRSEKDHDDNEVVDQDGGEDEAVHGRNGAGRPFDHEDEDEIDRDEGNDEVEHDRRVEVTMHPSSHTEEEDDEDEIDREGAEAFKYAEHGAGVSPPSIRMEEEDDDEDGIDREGGTEEGALEEDEDDLIDSSSDVDGDEESEHSLSQLLETMLRLATHEGGRPDQTPTGDTRQSRELPRTTYNGIEDDQEDDIDHEEDDGDDEDHGHKVVERMVDARIQQSLGFQIDDNKEADDAGDAQDEEDHEESIDEISQQDGESWDAEGSRGERPHHGDETVSSAVCEREEQSDDENDGGELLQSTEQDRMQSDFDDEADLNEQLDDEVAFHPPSSTTEHVERSEQPDSRWDQKDNADVADHDNLDKDEDVENSEGDEIDASDEEPSRSTTISSAHAAHMEDDEDLDEVEQLMRQHIKPSRLYDDKPAIQQTSFVHKASADAVGRDTDEADRDDDLVDSEEEEADEEEIEQSGVEDSQDFGDMSLQLDDGDSDGVRVESTHTTGTNEPQHASVPARGAESHSDDDTDEEGTAAQHLAPSPAQVAVSQLPPLSGMRRPGGVGTLMKALNATRATMNFDDDKDDMDEVERLMMSQSLQHGAKSASVPMPKHDLVDSSKNVENDDEFDDAPAVLRVEKGDHEKEGDQIDDPNEDSVAEGSAALDESVEQSMGDEFSFGETDLDRLLAEDSSKPSATLAKAGKTHDDEEDEEDDDDVKFGSGSRPWSTSATSFVSSSSFTSASMARPGSALPTLKKPGLGSLLGQRSTLAEDDDDDMDEVERLLLAQSSMKTSSSLSRQPATQVPETDDFDDGEEATSPVDTRRHQVPPSHDDDEFAHFDHDESEESSATSPHKATHNGLSESTGSVSSVTRIPIFQGSTLADKVAKSDLTPLAGQRVVQEAAKAHHQIEDEEDEAEDYMEESFDLEESLQEDDE